jgi:hypothetical protein
MWLTSGTFCLTMQILFLSLVKVYNAVLIETFNLPSRYRISQANNCLHQNSIQNQQLNSKQIMKTKQNKTLIAVVILTAMLALNSCQKEILKPEVKKTTTDVAWVDDTYNDLMNFAVNINSGSFKTEDAFAQNGCAVVTDDTVSMPHTRTLDYGSGCADNDGKIHKGQIILTYNTTDFLYTAGAYVNVSLNNYFVDDNQITGSLSLQNTGTNGDGFISFTLNVDAKRILANNAGTDSVVGQQVVEWVAGSSTSESIDDEFSFTGGADGKASTGETFSVSIIQPLLKKRAPGCYHYVKGQTYIQISGQSDRYMDYGDGICDNLGVETVDGNSQTVTLD